ncbi:hypothetical protein L209DRAFT_64732 [Thermothelomyces heterothallicus CBS 203.75]
MPFVCAVVLLCLVRYVPTHMQFPALEIDSTTCMMFSVGERTCEIACPQPGFSRWGFHWVMVTTFALFFVMYCVEGFWGGKVSSLSLVFRTLALGRCLRSTAFANRKFELWKSTQPFFFFFSSPPIHWQLQWICPSEWLVNRTTHAQATN